jgi:hypothetical protein
MRNAIVFTVFLLVLSACDNGADNVYSLEEVNGKPVVKGSENGLMWYMDEPDNPNTKLNQLTYENAQIKCAELDWAGFTDWRLPTIDELRTLVIGFEDVETGGRCRISSSCLTLACLSYGQKSSSDYPCSNYKVEELMQGPGPDGCYFDDVWRTYCGKYWSSSKVVGVVDEMVFQLDFADPAIAAVMAGGNTYMAFSRCVRK